MTCSFMGKAETTRKKTGDESGSDEPRLMWLDQLAGDVALITRHVAAHRRTANKDIDDIAT